MDELFGKAGGECLQGTTDSSATNEENKFNSVWFNDPVIMPRFRQSGKCLDNNKRDLSDNGFWYFDQLIRQNRSHIINDDLENQSFNATSNPFLYKDVFPTVAAQKSSPQKDAQSSLNNSHRMLYSKVLSGGIKIESSSLTPSSSSSSFASSFASPSSPSLMMSASKRNPSRYKTELCRPFQENGRCQYGDKCQFAHGLDDLRTVTRHPKYKTDLCKTFHTNGFCPYGPRCHFIHSLDELNAPVYPPLSTNGQTYSPPTTPIPVQAYANLHQIPFLTRSAPPGFVDRPSLESLKLKLSCITINNQSVESSGTSSASSLSPILQTDSDDQSEFQPRLPVFSSFLK